MALTASETVKHKPLRKGRCVGSDPPCPPFARGGEDRVASSDTVRHVRNSLADASGWYDGRARCGFGIPVRQPPRLPWASQQLADQFAVFEQVLETAVGVGQRQRVRINAQLVIHRVEHVLEMDGPLFGHFSTTVRGGRSSRSPATTRRSRPFWRRESSATTKILKRVPCESTAPEESVAHGSRPSYSPSPTRGMGPGALRAVVIASRPSPSPSGPAGGGRARRTGDGRVVAIQTDAGGSRRRGERPMKGPG